MKRINKTLKISAAPKQTTRLKNSLKVKPNYNRILDEVFGSVGNNKFSDLPIADKNSLFFPLMINFITGLISFICKPE